MEKIVFKLKQHTPIVHFEPKLKNSTLRASEVKPALDRFIVEKKCKTNELKQINRDWFIGDASFPALNYKMKIYQETKEGDIKQNPNYFGRDNKNLVFGENDAECTLHIFSSSLARIITKDVLMEFFLLNNFGCRKTKGSGSYTLSWYKSTINNENFDIKIEDNLEYVKKTTLEDDNKSFFNEYLKFDLNENDKKDKNKAKVFRVINYYWQRLKSGVNYTYDYHRKKELKGHYQPSFLRDYIEGYRWEKRWLKEKFMNLVPLSVSPDPKFARALLGLPSNYLFLDKGKLKKYSPKENKIALNYKFDVIIKAPEGINRIPAPITFKPIINGGDCYIFLLIDKSYSSWKIENKTFTFEMKNQAFPLIDSLETPNELIDLNTLLTKYHKSLGNEFDAFTYNKSAPFAAVSINHYANLLLP